MTVEPAFSVDFHGMAGRSERVVDDHRECDQVLAMDYQRALTGMLARWPRQSVHAVHHAMSWEHASALAQAIRALGPSGDRLNHLVFLSYSPGIDEAGRVFDRALRENNQLAFRSLDRLPNTRLYASCGEYAAAYASVLDRPAPLP